VKGGIFMTILTSTTSTALWHDIVHDAEKSCAIVLKEDVESYLVFLLMRYTNQPQLATQVMATEFLQGVKMSASKQEVVMQGVGDKCLLFAGLYPNLAEKRLVKISYFVNIGKTAYITISKKSNDLYGLLSTQFVSLMDVLQSIRLYTKHHPDLLPLQAYDLWNETGSQRAFSVLQQFTHGIPIPIKKE
jgi:hypothetical protein